MDCAVVSVIQRDYVFDGLESAGITEAAENSSEVYQCIGSFANIIHRVNSVRIQSFSGPYFPTFEPENL